jgi:hypothetical protein
MRTAAPRTRGRGSPGGRFCIQDIIFIASPATMWRIRRDGVSSGSEFTVRASSRASAELQHLAACSLLGTCLANGKRGLRDFPRVNFVNADHFNGHQTVWNCPCHELVVYNDGVHDGSRNELCMKCWIGEALCHSFANGLTTCSAEIRGAKKFGGGFMVVDLWGTSAQLQSTVCSLPAAGCSP